jgi:hypothetical protein
LFHFIFLSFHWVPFDFIKFILLNSFHGIPFISFHFIFLLYHWVSFDFIKFILLASLNVASFLLFHLTLCLVFCQVSFHVISLHFTSWHSVSYVSHFTLIHLVSLHIFPFVSLGVFWSSTFHFMSSFTWCHSIHLVRFDMFCFKIHFVLICSISLCSILCLLFHMWWFSIHSVYQFIFPLVFRCVSRYFSFRAFSSFHLSFSSIQVPKNGLLVEAITSQSLMPSCLSSLSSYYASPALHAKLYLNLHYYLSFSLIVFPHVYMFSVLVCIFDLHNVFCGRYITELY